MWSRGTARATHASVTEPHFDVDAYFARIGYTGPRAPTLDVLAAVLERHVLAIPFENLDILLGRTVALDVTALERKLVHGRRGGYCFEHNTLLGGVLRQLGFEVVTLAARVRWGAPPDVVPPRTHMLLSVALEDGRRLVDGGFGGIGLTAPLRFDVEGEQPSLFEPQRLCAVPGGQLLQVSMHGEWRDLYVFTHEPRHPIDFEVANWFTSTHPRSRFKQNLVVNLAQPGERLSLVNRELSVYRSGTVTKTAVNDPDQLLDVLATRFQLPFPAGTRFGGGDASIPAWAR
jgi:N-hydroxyarylamine O-acetyltransferase